MQTHRIVQPRLDVPRAVRRRAVKVAHADAYRLRTALEVRPHGRCKEAKLICIRRLHADHLARREDERAQIERCVRAVRRHIIAVRRDHRVHRLDKALLGERRHLEIRCRRIHARRIEIGAERHDMTVHGLICLQPLEDLLAVVQNARTLAERNRRIGRQSARIPRTIRIVRHIPLGQCAVRKPQISPVNIRSCHNSASFLQKCSPIIVR